MIWKTVSIFVNFKLSLKAKESSLICSALNIVYLTWNSIGRWNFYYYGKTEGHLKVRSGELIGISLLTLNKMNPCKESSIRDQPPFALWQ